MRSGGSKAKGIQFERQICKDLSLWISGGKREDVFWRSAMSGGRATVREKYGIQLQSQVGDISPISALGETLLDSIVIECKFYKDLELFKGITTDNGVLYGFWKSHQSLAYSYRKYPMLIAKQNNMPTCVLLPRFALGMFSIDGDDYIIASLPRWGCVTILFDVFLREARMPSQPVTFGGYEPKRIVLA